MGDINQSILIQKYHEDFKGPFLEIGSKDYGSTQDMRSIFSSRGTYIGIDLEAGIGVDITMDMTEDFQVIDSALNRTRFGTIFCLSVLEHCSNPFKMAENIVKLLKSNGKLVVSVPFSWKIHAYPNDYWRFTPEGVKLLFSEIQFDTDKCVASTPKKNHFFPIDEKLTRIGFSFSEHQKQGHFLRGISAKVLKFLSFLGIHTWLTGYRYLYPPTNLFMLGTRMKQDNL